MPQNLVSTIHINWRNQSTTAQQIETAIVNKINMMIKSSIPEIRQKVRDLVDEQVRRSTTWDSLLTGELRRNFGLINAYSVQESIINTIVKNTTVRAMAFKESILGIQVQILRRDYNSLLTLEGAFYISIGRKKTSLITWLRWLLTRNDPIIYNYRILDDGTARRSSRTGSAIMVPSKRGGSWQVPPQWSGAQDDNFLTKSLYGIEEKIDGIITNVIRRNAKFPASGPNLPIEALNI